MLRMLFSQCHRMYACKSLYSARQSELDLKIWQKQIQFTPTQQLGVDENWIRLIITDFIRISFKIFSPIHDDEILSRTKGVYSHFFLESFTWQFSISFLFHQRAVILSFIFLGFYFFSYVQFCYCTKYIQGYDTARAIYLQIDWKLKEREQRFLGVVCIHSFYLLDA